MPLDSGGASAEAPLHHGGARYGNTTLNVACILGGADNKAPSTGDPEAPMLIIDGMVIFGGLDVKLRKTLRERVVEFADHLRAMFGR